MRAPGPLERPKLWMTSPGRVPGAEGINVDLAHADPVAHQERETRNGRRDADHV